MQREVDRDDTAPARSDGAPTDPVTSDERPAESDHGPIAQLLIAWSQLSVILLPYALAGWISAPLGTGGGADTSRLGERFVGGGRLRLSGYDAGSLLPTAAL